MSDSLPQLAARPSRVLVTGGAGFIGSALVWALNRHGVERVVVVDRLGSDEKWRNLVPLRFEDYLEADDLFPRLENGALGSFDLVLHLGACSATTERDATYLVHNNFEFTKRLAHWAVEKGARFAYASSAATYGDGSAGMDDIDDSAVALSRLRPLNMYGYSKHLFDQYAARAGMLPRIVGLKYFNVFGPNEAHKGDMRSLVHKAYGQIVDTGRVQLFRSHRPEYRDGEQQRDFLYVKDAVAMSLHLAMSSSAAGLYNIGSGEANTWLALVDAIFAAMGRERAVDFVDIPEAIRAKYQYHTRASIGRLRATGYEAPVTPLPAAVRDYVVNYLAPDARLEPD
ncbi:MAG: ADP-glyceromanno-heptose 6-epimerase [Gemmatimonadaceae bacterium]|nr:ADP-glyceromanno-heptose 6-epimerase [Gemmatimonadaceae bacterium]